MYVRTGVCDPGLLPLSLSHIQNTPWKQPNFLPSCIQDADSWKEWPALMVATATARHILRVCIG